MRQAEYLGLSVLSAVLFWVPVLMMLGTGNIPALIAFLSLIFVFVLFIVVILMATGNAQAAGRGVRWLEHFLFAPIYLLLGGSPGGGGGGDVAGKAGETLAHKLLEFIFELEFVQSILESLEAIDIWKRGPPLREGEAYAVDDVVRHYWGRFPGGAGGDSSLGEIYHNKVKSSFVIWRRGWAAEYMGDAYTQGEGQRILFLINARLGLISDLLYDIKNSATMHRGRPQTWRGKFMAFFVWTPFFFHYTFLTLVILNERGIAAITEIILMPTVILAAICFSKWYGKHGLYIPGLGTQTIFSAASFIGLAVLVMVVPLELGLSALGAGDVWYNMMFLPMPIVNQYPNPLFFGVGAWVTGMDAAQLLLLLGLAGIGNMYYALHEEHTSMDEGWRQVNKKLEEIRRKV